jgi:hypothetical protein
MIRDCCAFAVVVAHGDPVMAIAEGPYEAAQPARLVKIEESEIGVSPVGGCKARSCSMAVRKDYWMFHARL